SCKVLKVQQFPQPSLQIAAVPLRARGISNAFDSSHCSRGDLEYFTDEVIEGTIESLNGQGDLEPIGVDSESGLYGGKRFRCVQTGDHTIRLLCPLCQRIYCFLYLVMCDCTCYVTQGRGFRASDLLTCEACTVGRAHFDDQCAG